MSSHWISRCLFFLGLVAASTIPSALQAQAGQTVAPRIVERVDESRLAVLKGNTRPEARPVNDRGAVSPDMPMPGMILVLRRGPEQQAAFDTFVESQYDTKSSNFHHWLTPEEVGQKFGLAQADLDAVSNWLLNHGFSVDSVSRDRLSIQFSGNAAKVQEAFHTEIHHLQVKGIDHVANMSDPQIPAALTPVVVGVEALHNFFPHPLHTMGSKVRHNSQTGKWERISAQAQSTDRKQPVHPGKSETLAVPPQFNTGGTTNNVANIEDVVPYDIATIYNILPLWNASPAIDGTGQTIAIVGTSDINPADVQTFRAAFGLPAYSALTGSTPGFSVIHPNTAPGDCSTAAASCIDDLIENSLDVEWSGAVAKNANIVLVASSPGTGTTYTADPVYVSSNYIVGGKTTVAALKNVNIMNVSYGECELFLGTAGNAGYNSMWQTAASEGIAVFVSSGDEGAASCDAGGDEGGSNLPYGAQFGTSVSGVASTPYNVAVGGTDFEWDWTNTQSTYWSSTNNTTTLASALGYIPEYPWNDMCTNSYLVSSLNSANKLNLTATQWCDDIGSGYYTFGSSEDAFLSLVDTVGGSGGVSACTTNDGATVASCTGGYATPSWQTGVTGLSSFSKRAIPDVSFFAANGFSGSAYVICVSANGSCSYAAGTEPTGEEVGGTSVASPIMAGVMALINEKAGSNQGNPNSILYGIAAKETYSGCKSESVPLTGSSCSFYDIDTGTISTPCDVGSPNCNDTGSVDYGILSGYDSTVGFDAATGLGSLNVANAASAFVTAVAPAVSFSPTSLTFASTTVGTSAATQTVTLTNSGVDALVITTVGITGTNTSSFSETDNCAAKTIAGSASCTITVTFTPTSPGSLTASISVANNAAGSPQTVSLTGIGAEVGSYTLSAAAASVAPGSSTTSAITATGSGGYMGPNTVTLSACTPANSPTGAVDLPTCTVTTAAVTFASGSTSGSGGVVTIGTTAASSSARKKAMLDRSPINPWAGGAGAVAVAGLLLFMPGRMRKWRALLGALVLVAALGVLSGCGGGSGGGGGGTSNPGTTAGTYTFTVTGTDSGGVKQTATLTLTVN
jgi:subtilase family serine protease